MAKTYSQILSETPNVPSGSDVFVHTDVSNTQGGASPNGTSSASTFDTLQTAILDASSKSDDLFLASGQAVGIGTQFPAASFHSFGAGVTSPGVRLEKSTNNYLLIQNESADQSRIDHVNNGGGGAEIIISPDPSNGTGLAGVRLLRYTDTTGTRGLYVHTGTASSPNEQARFVSGANSWVCRYSDSFQVGGGANAAELILHNSSKILTGAGDPEGVVTANAGSIYLDTGGALYIKSSGTGSAGWITVDAGAVTLANYTVVESANDFPAAVGGVRTLTAGTWRINGAITLGSDRLHLEKGALIQGGDAFRDSIKWTSGTGPFIEFEGTIGDEDFSISHITLNNLVPGQPLFGSSGQPNQIILEQVTTIGDIGDLSTNGSTNIIGGASILFGDGISFAGACNNLIIRQRNFSGSVGGTGDILDFGTATFNLISLLDVQLTTGTNQTAIRALGSNGNLNPSGRGEVRLCRFGGTGTNLAGGISIDDLQWVFAVNVNQAASVAACETQFSSNVLQTVANQVFVRINAGYLAPIARRFTVATNGQLTYNDSTPRSFQLVGSILARMASGGTKSCSFQVFIIPIATGIPVGAGLPVTVDLTGSNQILSSSAIIEDVKPGDIIEIRARNNADAIGIVVEALDATVIALPTGF